MSLQTTFVRDKRTKQLNILMLGDILNESLNPISGGGGGMSYSYLTLWFSLCIFPPPPHIRDRVKNKKCDKLKIKLGIDRTKGPTLHGRRGLYFTDKGAYHSRTEGPILHGQRGLCFTDKGACTSQVQAPLSVKYRPLCL